jgi:hypothetical protein
VNGRGARRKGHDFERELVHVFRAVFGEDVRRGCQFRDGAEAADVVTPALWVEAKRGRRTNPRAALAQAVEACGERPLWPVAVCKDDKAPPFVAMRLDDFIELLGEWWQTKKA